MVRRVRVEQPKTGRIGLAAGYSALSSYTSLAAPRTSTVAVANTAWPGLRDRLRLVEAEAEDPDLMELELWSYAPEAVSGGEVVDPLSLYLSLAGTTDERVEAPLEELLEGMAW